MRNSRSKKIHATVKRCPRLTLLLVAAVMSTSGTSTAGQQVTFTQEYGVMGDHATLRCTYQEWNETVTLVLWRRAKDFDLVYQYVNRQSITHEGPIQAFKNRSVSGELNTAIGYHEIILKDPQRFDQVGFVCEFFGETGYGRAEGQLQLNELPRHDPEVIVDNKKVNTTKISINKGTRILSGSINDITNTTITLMCRAYRSVPTSSITCNTSKPFTLKNKNQQNKGIFIEKVVVIDTTDGGTGNVTCNVTSPGPKPNSYTTSVIHVQVSRSENERWSRNRVVLTCSLVLLALIFILVVVIVLLKIKTRQREPRITKTHADIREEMNTTRLVEKPCKQEIMNVQTELCAESRGNWDIV